MILFEIAQLDRMFSDRQEAAFRLYLTDPDVRKTAETLIGYHRHSLEALAAEKPDGRGVGCCRRMLFERRSRLCRALDALARRCPKPIKISFIPMSYNVEAIVAGFL